MRPLEQRHEVLRLVGQRLGDSEISRRTGVPRATVRDWRRTGRAWKGADTSCGRCGAPEHRFDELPAQSYAYLLGLYLGDGHIAHHHKRVFHLRITLDLLHPDIARACAAAMEEVLPGQRAGLHPHSRDRCLVVSMYSNQWPCLIPQHGPGRKHERRIELCAWQRRIVETHPEALLRGLIHSDGSRFINRIRHPRKTYAYPRYQFTNRSDNIRRIFCDACDLTGVEWRMLGRHDVSIARRASVARLDEFVGPKS